MFAQQLYAWKILFGHGWSKFGAVITRLSDGQTHARCNFLLLLPEGTSKIHFGSNAIVSGEGTVSTTMFMKKENHVFYYLNLDAVSVEETRIETLGTPFHAVDGNIIIDSGTTFTYLPMSYYSLVREAVEKVVTAGE
ncbi:unnamed protein product [Brassica napus]|uniref:(rape) hypothetical protein n=1 Tax=Brassica napus TaxID=3708 RepID=A0A816JTK6_BRANA|nr:unnamed protein product [Brassica napus]